jgi:hypothetical protein
MPLRRCILRLDEDLLRAQENYTRRCRLIAQDRRNAHARLLELAPEKLRPVLEPALQNLFAYKKTSFHLRVADYRGDVEITQLLATLSDAWKEVVEIDVAVDHRKGRPKYTLHLRAV